MKKCIKIIFVFLLILTFAQYFNVNAVYSDEKFGATYEGYKKKYYIDGKWNFDEFLDEMKTKQKSEEKFQKQFEEVKKILRSEQAEQETTRTDSKASEAYNEIINQLNIAYENKGYAPKLSSGKKATVSINDSAEDKKKYTADQIKEYRELYGITEETTDEETREIWVSKLKDTGSPGDAVAAEAIYAIDHNDDIIYQNPEMTGETETTVGTIENIMDDADEFMNKEGAEEINPLGDKQSLQKFSQTISGILLTVGIVIAVIMGGILGIKYMTGPVEDKADIKQLLVPYVIGCIVVFGAITIWSIVVNFGEQFDEKASVTGGEEQGSTISTSSTSSTSGSDTGTI